ncbi:MAG: ferritin [Clostridiales Family XIII bacterium]|jgi:ferritin|nr:ferritin [Clostridiales Family XIII bacterium]
MIKDNVAKAISDQINAEYYSAYLYMYLSSVADDMGYTGIQNWLRVQAKEEMAHATHMYEHLLERDGDIDFGPIASPKDDVDYHDVRKIFEKVLEHEKLVTQLIDNIATLAMQEGDHATYTFFTWYVNEQVEEVDTASNLLKKVKLIEHNPGQLYDLDTDLATRVFVDPFAGGAA